MVFMMVTLSFINIAASIIVNNGEVNIKVMASATGMNLTLAKDVSIVKLPNSPSIHSIIL